MQQRRRMHSRDFLELNDAYHVVTAQVRQKAALPVPSGLLAAVPLHPSVCAGRACL